MDSAQLQQQFSEFFLIAHPIKVNIEALDQTQQQHDFEAFQANMPYAFKIAGEMSQIQSQALKPLRNMGEKLEELVDYLKLQAQKIDLMMSYILQQQDSEACRATAIKFGGGGVIVEQNAAVEIGSQYQVKLFLESESAAVFCYATALASEQQGDVYHNSFAYTHIRDSDQELLVRASLHLQTQALRAKQTQ